MTSTKKSESEVFADTFTPKKRPQFLATGIVSLGSLLLGMTLGWSAPSLPQLAKDERYEDLSTSWVASLSILGALFCGPMAGLLVSQLGSKRTMQLLTIPLIISQVSLIAGPQLPYLIYLGRFLAGISSGSFTVTNPIYVSEISEERVIQITGNCMVLSVVFGILISLSLGAYTSTALISSMVWISVAGLIFAIILFIGLWFIPETPKFHLDRGDVKGATKSLMWLRGAQTSGGIEHELAQIQTSIDLSNGGQELRPRDFCVWPVMKPMLIMICLMFCQQFSAINGIIAYAVDIFLWAGSSIDPSLASILVGVTQVAFMLVSIVLIHSFQRKIILAVSFGMMGVALVGLGVFFYLKEMNGGDPPPQLGWLPLCSVILFIVAYSFGVGPIPWLVLADIIPQHVKGFSTAVVTSCYWIGAFVSIKTFEDFGSVLGWDGAYYTFACICFAGMAFSLVVIPNNNIHGHKSVEDDVEGGGGGDVEKVYVLQGDAPEVSIPSIPVPPNSAADSECRTYL